MDDIVEDARREVEVMLAAWQTQGSRGGMFRPQNGDGLNSGASSISDFYGGETANANSEHNLLKVTVNDLGREIERDAAIEKRRTKLGNAGVAVPSNLRMSSTGYYGGDEGSALLGAEGKDSAGVSPGNMLNAGVDYMTVNTGTSAPAAGSSKGPRLTWANKDDGKSS